ncbi:MAG: hypothetical protein KAI94_12520 [Anaerolineales bacterium]|nr:hypothetical protein [Anaerolineales bacterium]
MRRANAEALRRLALVLEPAGLYVEDVLAVIDSPKRRATRRPAVLDAVRGMHESVSGNWSILSAQTDSLDHGFVVLDLLDQLGSDVSVVSFPRGNRAMVMVECSGAVVEVAGIDLAGVLGELASDVKADETWGTPALGRIIAPIPERGLMKLCVDAVSERLSTEKGDLSAERARERAREESRGE